MTARGSRYHSSSPSPKRANGISKLNSGHEIPFTLAADWGILVPSAASARQESHLCHESAEAVRNLPVSLRRRMAARSLS